MAADPGALSVAELAAHANARAAEGVVDADLFGSEARTAAQGTFLLDRYDAWIETRTDEGNVADAAFWTEERAVVSAHMRLAMTNPQTCPIDNEPWPCASLTSRLKAFRYHPDRPA